MRKKMGKIWKFTNLLKNSKKRAEGAKIFWGWGSNLSYYPPLVREKFLTRGGNNLINRSDGNHDPRQINVKRLPHKRPEGHPCPVGVS